MLIPPENMARILLPTDFSVNALHAAEYAVKLLGATGHEYVVLHAYMDLGSGNPMLANMAADALATTREEFEKAVKRVRLATGAEQLTSRMVPGPLSIAVQRILKEEGADLVVMGRRGSAGASFFGSNTTDTIRNGGIPVLAVPEQVLNLPLKSILLANDHSAVSTADLAILREVALTAKAEVKVVHIKSQAVGDEPHWNKGIYETGLHGVPVSFVVRPGDEVPTAIAEAAQEQGAGMVAVLHRQRDFFDRLFKPSVARKLALKSELPLLVLSQK